MSEPIWSSKAIRITKAVCFDVKVNSGVVLGMFIGEGEVATDHHLTPDQARTIACALIEGADAAEAAGGAA